ncbi:MAG: response regulator [Kiritimatiellaeota bacterium]|nr:response regulator [Kiritimatiellota bacterium]
MNFLHSHRPFEILLVEDNPGDVRLTREALRDTSISHHLHVVTDGVEAMTFLRHQGNYTGAPQPDLILLDLNMPRMDGRRVLALLKKDAKLRRIPVVILSSSQNETDIQSAYELQANCYITKPTDFEQFMGVVKEIEEFWAVTAELPLVAKQGQTN